MVGSFCVCCTDKALLFAASRESIDFMIGPKLSIVTVGLGAARADTVR